MAQIIPGDFKDGDALEPWHLNYIFRFIRRWMKFDVSIPLQLDNDDNAPPHLSLTTLDELVPVLTPAGGIVAGSYTTPTSGTCTLLEEASGGPGFTATAAYTETLYNPYGVAVPASKFAWAKWRGRWLYAVTWDC